MSEQSKNIFDKDKKIEFFDEIEARYFHRNFGTMMKSDFETLLFSMYVRQCKIKNFPTDDYSLSKELGITQNRVRALKQAVYLKYPPADGDDDWKQKFAFLVKDAIVENGKVIMTIRDVGVKMELENAIEQMGSYVEYQLNPRLFKCPVQSFIALCNKIDGSDGIKLSDGAKKVLQDFEPKTPQEESAIQKLLNGAIDSGLSDLICEASEDLILLLAPKLFIGKYTCEILKILVHAAKKKLG